MDFRLSKHLRDNAINYIALFCFAMAGTASAVDGPLAGQNTVGSEDIIGNEVLSDDIGNGRIFNLDIADDIIQSGKVKNATLTGADVGSNAVGEPEISNGSLYNDNSLTTADIDESTLYNDNSLAANDLAPNSVASSELAPGAVGAVDAGALTAADLATGSVGSSEIAQDAVGQSELTSIRFVEANLNVPASSSAAVLVACPAGAVAIGGGVEMFSSSNIRLNSSFPSESTTEVNFPEDGDAFTAWWVRVQNTGSPPESGDAYAICVVNE